MFLYFVETDAASATPELLKEWGLDYALDCVESRRSRLENREGLLVAAPGLKDRFRIEPASQTWRKLPAQAGAPDRRVGLWKGEKVDPEGLARPTTLKGRRVPDAQGRLWIVPVVRAPNEAGEVVSRMPCYWDVDETGALIPGDPVVVSEGLYGATQGAWEAVKEGRELDPVACWPLCVRLLQANYRIGPVELAMLETFQRGHELACPGMWVYVAVGGVEWSEWKKVREGEEADPTSSQAETLGGASSDTEAA